MSLIFYIHVSNNISAQFFQVMFLYQDKSDALSSISFCIQKDMKTRGAKVSGHQRSSSFDATKEDNSDEPVVIDNLQKADTSLAISFSKSIYCAQAEQGENQNSSATISAAENGLPKLRDSSRGNKFHKSSRDDKKLLKSSSQDERKSTGLNHTNLEFHNIKISQVQSS